jgi:methionyl-tRNA formyltransferase
MKAVTGIEKGTVKAVKQDDTKATFTRMLKKSDGLVDFSTQSSEEIFNKWRAYSIWPGIFALFSGPAGRINITLTDIVKAGNTYADCQAGSIVQADKKGLVIRCKKGFLSLLRLKPWGKREMDYISFINGYKPGCGRIF